MKKLILKNAGVWIFLTLIALAIMDTISDAIYPKELSSGFGIFMGILVLIPCFMVAINTTMTYIAEEDEEFYSRFEDASPEETKEFLKFIRGEMTAESYVESYSE